MNTVKAILEESNVDKLVESGRVQVCNLIPESIRVVKHRLEKNSETAAFKVLEGIGVLGTGKLARQQDAGLTLAIQNLMGNVTVNQPQNANDKPIDVKAEEPTKPADQ